MALIFYTDAGYFDGSCRSLRSLRYIAPYFYFVRYDLLLRHSALHLTLHLFKSLGNAAIFLIGGLTRDTEPIAILLRSGDIAIMSGPACRRAYHAVPRILEGSLPPHLKAAPLGDDIQRTEWEPYEEYLSTTRININVRQVFPKGFDPMKACHST